MPEPGKRPARPVRRWFIRNPRAPELFENFLISAVVAVLLIRLGLHLTGYPQLGGGGLHIAHMLWGGLGMLAAIIITIQFTNQTAREWASVIGGISFGTFIDELGKFITSDNNYFYQPAAAAIYVIFVVLFLAVRWLNRPGARSTVESLVNAAGIIQEGLNKGGLDAEEKQTALRLLATDGTDEPMSSALRVALDQVPTLAVRHPFIWIRLRRRLTSFYRKLIAVGWFKWTVVGVFLATSASDFASMVLSIEWSWITAAIVPTCILVLWLMIRFIRKPASGWRILRWAVTLVVVSAIGLILISGAWESINSFADGVNFISSVASAILTLIGAVTIFHSRLGAYQWFRRATLVSILVTDVFTFYEFQFVALGVLAVDLLLLIALNYMIDQEKARPSNSRTVC